jgi:ABC-2 type transport system ATP-binding protein
MRQLLLDLADRGKTLIVTSHILPELARICHRVAIITRGRLRALGTLDEIARQLNPLRTIEVLLTREEDLDRAQEIVRRQAEPGAEITSSVAERAIRLRTARNERDLSALLAELVAAEIGVVQFRELQGDLEEAFMSVAASGDAETPRTAAAGVGGSR